MFNTKESGARSKRKSFRMEGLSFRDLTVESFSSGVTVAEG